MARVEAVLPFSQTVIEDCAELWQRATSHSFVLATGDGSLPPERFHVWIQQDRRFVQGLAGFLGELVSLAPDEDREGLHSGRAALEPELALFEEYGRRERVSLDVPALGVCEDYIRFLRGCAGRGYEQALVAYYACERVYLQAWQNVAARAVPSGRYGDWIENWTSEPFAVYVSWLGSRVDELAAGSGAIEDLRAVFRRTVEFEIAFWDACWH